MLWCTWCGKEIVPGQEIPLASGRRFICPECAGNSVVCPECGIRIRADRSVNGLCRKCAPEVPASKGDAAGRAFRKKWDLIQKLASAPDEQGKSLAPHVAELFSRTLVWLQEVPCSKLNQTMDIQLCEKCLDQCEWYKKFIDVSRMFEY